MTKNCIACGKNIGLLGVRIPLLDTDDLVICSECFEKMPEIVNSLYRNKVFLEKKELRSIKEDVLKQLSEQKFNQETINVVTEFLDKKIEKAKEGTLTQEELELRQKIAKEKQERKSNFQCTTGYNFEGYKIIEYKDIISSEVVLGTGFFSEVSAQIDDFFGTTSSPYEKKISDAKNVAKDKLVFEAVEIGANAVIGIDFDIMTIGNNMIVVSVNGTAVVIEKLSD